jgi:hypothetical protein
MSLLMSGAIFHAPERPSSKPTPRFQIFDVIQGQRPEISRREDDGPVTDGEPVRNNATVDAVISVVLRQLREQTLLRYSFGEMARFGIAILVAIEKFICQQRCRSLTCGKSPCRAKVSGRRTKPVAQDLNCRSEAIPAFTRITDLYSGNLLSSALSLFHYDSESPDESGIASLQGVRDSLNSISRGTKWELAAIAQFARLCAKHKCSLHPFSRGALRTVQKFF